MSWKLANFMDSRLSQAIAAAATTIYIDADDVDLLPTLGVGDKAKAVIFNATNREIVNITAWTTDGTLTVERAKEGTTAVAFAAGTKIVHTPTAEILQAVLDATIQAVYRGTAAGTDAITVTTTGSVPTPSDGDEVTFEVANTNTAGVTLTVTNGSSTIGPFSVVKQDGTALRAGELRAGWRAKVLYDSTAIGWTLISQTSKRYDIDRINTGPLTAGNQLPNGSFDAWINATTFATPASGTETADNVVAEYDGTIGAFSVSRQTFTLGQTDVDGGPKYYLRWDQSSAGAASTYRRLRMRIPQVGKYALELVIASLYAKADIGRNVTARLIQSFGTGGAPSAEVVLASEVWTLTTGWQRFDLSTTVTSIAGKTLGSDSNDGLILELSLPVNATMTVDFAMGQFELGDVMTKPHSRLPWGVEFGGTGGSFQSIADYVTYLNPLILASYPDLAAIEALAGTSGGLFKTAANTWALRNLAVGTGLTVTNPAGVAGDPTVSLGTALTNYNADPMSVAELASVTAVFGTAAFKNEGTGNTLDADTVDGIHAATIAQLGVSNVFTAAQEVTVTAAGVAFTVTSTDAGATVGPAIVLDRNSASPAVSDYLGAVYYRGRDSGGNATDYVITQAFIIDPTNGSEDSLFLLTTLVAGAAVEQFRAGNNQVRVPTGTAGIPGLAVGLNGVGFYESSANIIACATGGAARWSTSTTQSIDALYPIVVADGSAASPAFAFRSDTDCGMYRIGADNIALAVGGARYIDITSARILTSAPLRYEAFYNAADTKELGYKGAPLIGDAASNAAISFALADAGCTAYHDEVTARTWTIPANASIAFPIGTVIIIDNTGNAGAAGTITLNITSDTLRRGDGVAGTGSRNISASSVAFIRKTKSTEWVITGAFT